MKALLTRRHAAPLDATSVTRLLPRIQSLIEASRQHIVSSANLTLVWLYWHVGRLIAEDIQKNRKRAGYGQRMMEQLAASLTRGYGRGFSAPNLWDMKRFFEGFEILQTASREFAGTMILPSLPTESSATKVRSTSPGRTVKAQILQTVSGESPARIIIDFARHHRLGWSHYRILLSVQAGLKRGFYFQQAAEQRWATRELQRQIDRALFERVALSRDTRALVRIERQRGPVETVRYEDAFKDPYLLDFLGLKGAYSEKDLEAAIIANLQQFLTELGSDFCFIRRQYPMRIDDDDYWLDLLFYHRRLRCLVAIDLKIGPFVAADKGQMDLYLAWLKKREWRQDAENEPLGLILCTSKKRQHVELLLSSGPHKMQVSEYLTQLPSKHVLADRLKVYSRLLADQ